MKRHVQEVDSKKDGGKDDAKDVTIKELVQKNDELRLQPKQAKRFFGGREGLKWDELPSEWRKDHFVIEAALRTTRYRDLPEAFKCEPNVIIEAMRPNRYPYLKDNIPWEAIPELARHNREVVLAALEHYPPCLDKWEDIPEELRDDLEIAAEAVLCYMVKAKDVPALQDPNNLRTLIEEEKLGWKYLPQALVNNIDFVTSLARVSIFDASCMIESVNGLSYERSFWVMLTKKSTKYSDYRYCLCDVVQEAPNFVLADESIMMGLIQRDEKVLECVPPTLWECPSFVQSVLKTQGCALWYLPREEQLQHVDLIAEHFSVMDITECHLERGAESVLPQLWKEEKIASSWVRNGYPFVKNFHPETMTNDRELILLLARNTRWTNWFSTVPVELRSDKKFVKDVMKVNVTCFLDLPEALQKDFDLALTFVINGAESTIKEYIRKTDDNWRSLFMEPLKRRIKGMQREWDGWDEFEAAFFERGALNVGPEVTSALKRHVLAYVGYSHQQQLDRAFSALEEYENIDIIQCS